MALYIPHSFYHLARLLYVRPETFGTYYVPLHLFNFPLSLSPTCQIPVLPQLPHTSKFQISNLFSQKYVSIDICKGIPITHRELLAKRINLHFEFISKVLAIFEFGFSDPIIVHLDMVKCIFLNSSVSLRFRTANTDCWLNNRWISVKFRN